MKHSLTGVLDYFVRHRTAPHILLVLLVIAGIYATTQIRSQFFPDIVRQVVNVSVVWSGAGPEEVDQAIVSRLEPRLRAVEGLADITATAREGFASIRMEFETDWNMEAAVDDVKTVVDEITDLPADSKSPRVRRSRFRDRVTDVVIAGPVPLTLLEQYAEELRTRLFDLGVTQSRIVGTMAPEIRVDVKRAALERHGISMEQIAGAIAAETGTQPVGEIADGVARVRTDATRESVNSIGQIAVRATTDGTKLRLADIADIAEQGIGRERALFVDGNPALKVRVDRHAQGDSIKMERTVRRAFERMQSGLPEGVEMTLTRTRALVIVERLNLLLRNGGLGLAIVLVLLFLFLSARTAFWVAAGIPVALLATVALMYTIGLTFNMISLFGLLICLGIVVDDAIVVGEHTDELAKRGASPTEAASQAAQRMFSPVFCASITTVIAFSALILIGGRFGRIMSDLPIVVAMVVVASLIECFLILPAHMRHALTHTSRKSILDAPSRFVDRGFRWVRERCFRPLIRTVIKLRYPVWGVAFLLLALSAAAVMDRTVRWRFFVPPERGVMTANIAMLPNATRQNTQEMLKEMERALEVVDKRYQEKHGKSPVELTVVTVGGTSGRGLFGSDTMNADRLGSLDVTILDPDERPYSAFALISDWQDEIRDHPRLERLSLRRERRGVSSDDISIQYTGADPQTLKQASQMTQNLLSRYTAVSGLDDNLAFDKPELVIALTARGEALGFTTSAVARALRGRLDGIEAVSFARGRHEVKVNVIAPEADVGRSYLQQVRLPIPGGGFVPLTSIATVTERQGFSVIRRDSGQRAITVTGELLDDAVQRDEVNDALRAEILPAVAGKYGVNYLMRGAAEDEAKFLTEARLVFYICLAGIFLSLCWVFGSWVRPIVIMLVIPFGLIGAIWGHYVHGIPLSMFSVIGLIGMSGIIINDSIVLGTTIDERMKTQEKFSAIVDGTCDRLRAVFLTTITTVGGLTPMLFEQSRNAMFLKPTVITLVYGLGVGFFVVLLVTPTMIAIQHDLGSRLTSLKRMASYFGVPGLRRQR